MKNSRSKTSTFDWTDDFPPANLSPHVTWARNIDWENTSLGPMSQWSPQLRSNASLIMQDSRPAVGFYGPDLIMIYNEAYIELLGGLHPCMGCNARIVLSSVWETHFEHIIQQNLAGETVNNDNTEVPLMRNGYVEETYFSVRFIPIFDSKGSTVGHYEPVIETVSFELCSSWLAAPSNLYAIVVQENCRPLNVLCTSPGYLIPESRRLPSVLSNAMSLSLVVERRRCAFAR
jgi:hypothetical protein